ncbi:MAG: methylaspartate mutase, partial [Candidatus Dadabacteria bacterium]
ITAQSAERAALGAGAIVLDTICTDDGRREHEKIERIRHLRPDILLMAGGTDGGAKKNVIALAEVFLAANPKPRFGSTLKLPIIYAGNSEIFEEIERLLSPIAVVERVDNLRPTIESEALQSARERIHEFFLRHVMSHAPGYGKLMGWTPVPIVPTPSAVGDMVRGFAQSREMEVLAVDIGGATTDVFSVFKDRESGEFRFNRTVSANLGMSYSAANVLLSAGVESIIRWLPFRMDEGELKNIIMNKMLRPTSIPQTLRDLFVEHALCREALRLSFEHHKKLAVGLSGLKRSRGIADIFGDRQESSKLVDMKSLDLIIGSGGVLSHAPERKGSALMMIDAFEPEGVTFLSVDSIFMMPHLGVFSHVHAEDAHEILIKDCLIDLGCCVAPVYSGRLVGREIASVTVAGGKRYILQGGEFKVVEVDLDSGGELLIEPVHRSVDVGGGKGKSVSVHLQAGKHILYLDGRNRPLLFEESDEDRIEEQRKILNSLGITWKERS